MASEDTYGLLDMVHELRRRADCIATLEAKLAKAAEYHAKDEHTIAMQSVKLAEAQAALTEAEDSIHTAILSIARDDWTKEESLNILRGTNKKLRQAIEAAKEK